MTTHESDAHLADLLQKIETNQRRRTRLVNIFTALWLVLLIAVTGLLWWRVEELYNAQAVTERVVGNIISEKIRSAEIENAKSKIISAWMFDGNLQPLRTEANLLRDQMSKDDMAQHFQRIEEYLWRGAILWRDRDLDSAIEMLTAGLKRFDQDLVGDEKYGQVRLLRGRVHLEKAINGRFAQKLDIDRVVRAALDDMDAVLEHVFRDTLRLAEGEENPSAEEEDRIRWAGLNFHYRGVLRLRVGRDEDALADFEIGAGMRAYPERSGGSQENISLVHLRLGNWEKARKNSEELTQPRDIGTSWNRLFLSIAEYQMGNFEAADAAFRVWMEKKQPWSDQIVRPFLTQNLINVFKLLKERNEVAQEERPK